jgi:predicted AlkP superfamily pyrophosphatase or phosphodiesterase
MSRKRFLLAGAAAFLMVASSTKAMPTFNGLPPFASSRIRHVLLLSIDGMHAVDFYNCSHGIAGANNGNPYCPNLAALGQTAINYVAASSSKPSDSFPGITALVSGGTPKSTGIYYDVAYDRSLDAPAQTTGTGLAGGSCTPNVKPTGTTTDYDQGIDFDDTKLNGGAPGAGPTEGGIASINPAELVRDPSKNCAPVYPWDFIRTNTIFGVVHQAGGYTAWIDKHPSYSVVAGPGGNGLNDYYSPEVDSNVIALPGVTTSEGASCATIRDTSNTSSWTNSFLNIQCYDALKVNALVNEIEGKTHDGAPARTPELFGMNFQSVYIGESLSESATSVGGYLNAAGLPSAALLQQIEYVDSAIGQIVNALKKTGNYENTLVIVTAKHGDSPIDTSRYVADTSTPATILATDLDDIPLSESPLNSTGIGATEDDVSVLWLNLGASVTDAVALLESNASAIGLGEIYYGPSLAMNYNVGGLGAGLDPRSPDIIVTPNIGVTYSGSTTMIGDHGGFGHDDTNVIMMFAFLRFTQQTVSDTATTAQVAPTILRALGFDPAALDAVRAEGTETLHQVGAQLGF